MDEIAFAESVKRKLSKEKFKNEMNEYQGKSLYHHPTYVIDSLSDYIRLVTIISSINKDTYYDKTVVFRGISDSEHSLIPGLSRMKNLYADMEMEIINEFLTRRPDAFRNLSDFDILAKMQHYGLPTRLLDFSLNPLVSLYFACESKTTKCGRVLCHNTYVQNDQFEYSKAICTTAVNKAFDENYNIEDYCCNDKVTLQKYLMQTYYYGETTVVRPKYWNQRIANQAGVFMIFPNHLHDKYKNVLIHLDEIYIHEAIQQYGYGAINKEIVEEIFWKEPIQYYKNHSDYYLSDSVFKKMYESYKNESCDEHFWDKNKKFFENRFTISYELKNLSEKIINNEFCSVIIEPNRKKKILKELSYVGIGADYIYPELEYTAQEIKRKYE